MIIVQGDPPETPEQRYWVRDRGMDYGPAPLATVREWQSNGQLSAEARMLPENGEGWTPVSEMLGFGPPVAQTAPVQAQGPLLKRSTWASPGIVALMVIGGIALICAVPGFLMVRMSMAQPANAAPESPAGGMTAFEDGMAAEAAALERAKTGRRQADVNRIESLCAMYRAEHGQWPSSTRDLATAGYIPPNEIPKDPDTGVPYQIRDGKVVDGGG
jgi:hypothetical protein